MNYNTQYLSTVLYIVAMDSWEGQVQNYEGFNKVCPLESLTMERKYLYNETSMLVSHHMSHKHGHSHKVNILVPHYL